jgi:adenylate cyclase
MKKKWVNSFTVALLMSLVSLFTYSLDLELFKLLESKSYDLKVRSRGVRDVTGQVVIVAIDEKSLKEVGRWPWPRTRLAQVISRLTEAGASAIGVDILFPEKDVYVPFTEVKQALHKQDVSGMRSEELINWLEKISDSDQQFAEAILKSERTVLGFSVFPTEDAANEQFVEKMGQAHLDLLDFSQFSVVQRFDSPDNPVTLRPVYAVGMSLPSLMDASNSAGYVSFIPESDGVIRWVPTVMQSGEYLFPPLSLQVLHEAMRLPIGVVIAPFGVDGVRLGETLIPTSESGDFLVNYYGPAYTFSHISAADVLSGKIGKAELENKIVLLGATAAGTYDLHVAPYGPLYPGVEVHANVIENVLQNDYLIRPEWLMVLNVVMILGSGLFLGIIAHFFKAYGMALFLAGGILSYLVADYYLFTVQGLWINTVYPVFTQIFVYSGVTLYKYAFEEGEKRFIKSAFGQFLSPVVVDRLVDNPSLLKLGGESKELTAFFSDVAGFSTISEKLSPKELVELLNDYLTEMTDIILKYEGTVDKFEGDAIIAFFGAPVPYGDHARRACLVAIEMQKRLEEMRAGWKAEGKHELFMRIGVNTGEMVIGNMGSRTRMDYTMMGDSVNLAARLEGVNKQYKTETMISEFTYKLVQGDIETRELDRIRVVGKKEPVKIYEVLGRKGEIKQQVRDILPQFNQGLQHYTNREWKEALDCFEKVLKIHDKDGPSLTYRQRCLDYQLNPPQDDWDGVYEMQFK